VSVEETSLLDIRGRLRALDGTLVAESVSGFILPDGKGWLLSSGRVDVQPYTNYVLESDGSDRKQIRTLEVRHTWMVTSPNTEIDFRTVNDENNKA
jgi:hypothetical protein